MAPKGKEAAAPKPDAKAKPKGKAKAKDDDEPKLVEPDHKEHDAEMEKIQYIIEGLQKEQKELSEKIGQRSAGKEGYFQQRDELRNQLDQFNAKIAELDEKKGVINKSIGDKRQESVDMRNQLNKMKKSIGYTNEGAIDDRIHEIEKTLNFETMTLAQEKALIKEIQGLKRNRPKVGQVNEMESSLQQRDTGAGLKENIGSIKEELNTYWEGKKKVLQAMSELKNSRDSQLGDYGKLIEQRDAIGKKIKEQIDIRNVKRDEFRQKERDYRQKKNELWKARQEKIQEERAAQRAQYDMQRRVKRAEEIDQQPYVTEMTLIEQTILFCKSLIADKGPAQKEEQKETEHTNPDGYEVLQKKEDRDEFYYAPTASKKKGKSKNKGGKEGGSSKPIKHNAETFKLFDQLKINAPITTDDIPPALEKLEEQLESYKEKIKVWEKNRDEMKQKILLGEDEAQAAEDGEKEENQEEQKADE